MNWRVIRWILVIILLILNIGLFGYSVYQKRQLYVVPTERIEYVRERFEEWGYQLPKEISRRQYPKRRLILEVTDLEDRANAFWSEDYEKSYMPGSRILYTCGTQTLTVDREQSSMVFTENDPDYQNADTLTDAKVERTAREQAQSMMNNKDLILVRVLSDDVGTRIYYFCEKYKDDILFANRAIITVTYGAVVRASVSQFTVRGYEDTAYAVYPIDELLYSCLRTLGQAEEGTQLNLNYGYAMAGQEDEVFYCTPSVWIGKPDGTGLMVDQLTDKSSDLF